MKKIFKRISCIFLMICILSCLSSLCALASGFIKIGDVSMDGKVNSKDYTLLKRHCLGTFDLEGGAYDAGDISGDGKVNSKDYSLLKRFCLGTYSFDSKDINMKVIAPVFSYGYWDSASAEYFVGNGEAAKKYISTQRYTKDTLPVGSVVTVNSLECSVVSWADFPKAGGTSEKIDARLEITEKFWQNKTSLAFNLSSKSGKVTIEDAEKCFKVEVPESTAGRRTYDWNNDGVLAILTVGNSFSDDAMEYVYDIAKSAGVKEVYLGNLYYSACRLEWHYGYFKNKSAVYDYRVNKNGKWVTTSKSTFEAAMNYKKWDYISFQESAKEKQTNESLYTHLGYLLETAKSYCPGAKLVWHQPWANPHENYGNDTLKMYDDCMTAARKIIEKYGFDEIITTGTAIQNLRTSFVDNDTRILRDGWHLSYDLGRYTAGLAFFTQLTGISVENISFAPATVSEDEKAAAIESAVNSLKRPRFVTNSVYSKNPTEKILEELEENYDLLEVDYQVGFWIAYDGTRVFENKSDFSKGFLMSGLYTKDTLPTGSVIIVEEGFKCRPEGWFEYPKAIPESSRAPFLTTGGGIVFVIPDDWYDVYTTRAFNLSVADGSNKKVSDLANCMKIYIPKR